MTLEGLKKLKELAAACEGWTWPDRKRDENGTHYFGLRRAGEFYEIGTIDASTYTDDYLDDLRILKFIRAMQPAVISELVMQAERQLSQEVNGDRERDVFEKWVSDQGVAADYRGDGIYGNPTVRRWREGFLAALELVRFPHDTEAMRKENEQLRQRMIELESNKALNDVAAERRRQVDAEGFSPERDDMYDCHQLSKAAVCYAIYTLAYPPGDPVDTWPWDKSWWKPSEDQRRNRVKAAALLIAEIERLDRVAMKGGAA